jgi:hypothetical protein
MSLCVLIFLSFAITGHKFLRALKTSKVELTGRLDTGYAHANGPGRAYGRAASWWSSSECPRVQACESVASWSLVAA